MVQKMLYRMSCMFQNTESAQAAAKRINDKLTDVFEIRLKYQSDYRDHGVTNNIVYARSGDVVFPAKVTGNRGIFSVENSNAHVPHDELSQECQLSVLTKGEYTGVISRIMVNEGGFDIHTFEERLF